MDRLGFEVVSQESSNGLIGVRQRWYWDCMMTKMTQMVVFQEVETL